MYILALLTPRLTHCLGYRDSLFALLEPGGDFMDNRSQGRGRKLGCHRVSLRQGLILYNLVGVVSLSWGVVEVRLRG